MRIDDAVASGEISEHESEHASEPESSDAELMSMSTPELRKKAGDVRLIGVEAPTPPDSTEATIASVGLGGATGEPIAGTMFSNRSRADLPEGVTIAHMGSTKDLKQDEINPFVFASSATAMPCLNTCRDVAVPEQQPVAT